MTIPCLSTDEVPDWLLVMRTITGTVETPGDADNPKIMAMATEIARIFPDMADYCAEYTHDSIAWCGLTVAYCMAMAGIRPPFGPTDTDKFLWALAWATENDFGTVLDAPRPGCIVVMERSGGGHVTLYESTEGSSYRCRGGNQSDAVNLSSYAISSVVALIWPREGGPVPPAERRELEKGDTGSDVAALQCSLGLPDDGDFGSITEAAVRSFQAAAGLGADGVVGANTWAEIDALDARKAAGDDGLAPDLAAEIVQLAEASPLQDYNWEARGASPDGYVPGMALAFALAATWLEYDNPAAQIMAEAASGNTDVDALAYYFAEFEDAEMDNSISGIDTLRHLFVLMIGLGMRESSGKYCEGRDMSASNVSADTCEAGLFQTSWNIRSASPELPPLLNAYWDDPNGFLPQFSKGSSPDSNDWQSYGTGDGARYQWLARYAPAFAVMVTAVGLRTRRDHWGPINRYEVELVDAADDLLLQVQALLDGAPVPPEPPEPGEQTNVVITLKTRGNVSVTINSQ